MHVNKSVEEILRRGKTLYDNANYSHFKCITIAMIYIYIYPIISEKLYINLMSLSYFFG